MSGNLQLVTKMEPGSAGVMYDGGAAVVGLSTGQRIDVVANPICHAPYAATLTFLDPPLQLLVPIPVTVKVWSDGLVEAHLSDALLYGTGDDEAEAMDDLRGAIADAWQHLRGVSRDSLAKPALRMWTALSAICREQPQQ